MGFPVIGYRSMLHTAMTISTNPVPDAGYQASDLQDHRAWKAWRSSALTTPQDIDIDMGAGGANADYLALVNHNMVAGAGQITVYADTVTPPTAVVQAAYSPLYDSVDFKSLAAPGTKRYWRVRLTHTGNFPAKPFVGELLLGLQTILPEYMATDLDPFMTQVEAESIRSAGGQALGTILRGRQHRATLVPGADAGIARSFHTSDLNAFVSTHARLRLPFVVVVDPDDADFSAPLFLKLPDSATLDRRAVGGSWQRLVLSLPVEEAFMEAA